MCLYYFSFDSKYTHYSKEFKAKKGTANGIKFPSPYIIQFMAELEEEILRKA